MASTPSLKDGAAGHAEELKASGRSGANHIEGNALLVDKHGTVRRLPLPSNDPNDPLNFTKWEKYAVIFCCCWFSTMGLSLASGLGSILGVFFQLYGPQGKDSEQVVYLLTIPSLCIGLGNFIILPMALAFGRRPVFLVSTLALLGATIASATQSSYNAHLVSRVFQGLACGASESLLPLMLTDITFIHERGWVFGLYWMVQNVFTSVLNVAGSYEVAALGWRWYYWVFVITVAAGLVFVFFGAFETRFSRSAANVDGRIVYTDDFGVTHVVSDDEAQDYLERMNVPSNPQTPNSHEGQRLSYLKRLIPWSGKHPQPGKMIVYSWINLIQSMTSPAILHAVLLTSIALAGAIDLSLTFDAILQGEYHWQAKDVGLINIGSIVGSLLGTAYCTILGEKFVLWLAERNRGVHKPEHRLIVMVPAGVLGTASLILYGAMAKGSSDAWGSIVSFSLFQACFTVILIVSTTFASEASPKHPGPALVAVVGTKNIVSFGATYGFYPLIAKTGGYYGAFGVLAALFGGLSLLGIPVYLLNPKWRTFIARRDAKNGVDTTD